MIIKATFHCNIHNRAVINVWSSTVECVKTGLILKQMRLSWSSVLKFRIFRNPDTKFWHDNLTPYFSNFVYFKFHTKTKFCLHLFSCQFIVKNAIFARKIWYRTWISYNTKFGHKIKGSDQRWPDELQKYRTWKIKYRFLEIREFVYRCSAKNSNKLSLKEIESGSEELWTEESFWLIWLT